MNKSITKFCLNIISKNGRNFGLMAFVLVLWIVLGILSPFFFRMNNMNLLMRQCSTILIGGTGMTFVLITAGTDLSVGSIAALSGMIVGLSATKWGLPAPIAIINGLLVGFIFGLINGVLISKYKLQPMVCTLGTSSIAKGLTLLSTSGRSLFVTKKMFINLGNESILGIPIPAIAAILFFILSYIILSRTLFGRSVYAIGGNREATRLSGINTFKVETFVYAISGVAASIVGIILVCTLGASEPTVGTDLALDSIAVSAIGGISLFGGVGSLFGTLLGAVLIGTIKNGLTMLNIVSYYQQLIIGFTIILAVLLEQLKKK